MWSNQLTTFTAGNRIKTATDDMKKMLRLTLIAAFALLISLPACTKPEKQIVGKWEMTSLTVQGERLRCRDAYMTFKDNGSVRLSGEIDYEDWDYTSKWAMEDDELVIKGGDIDWGEEYYVLRLEIDELTKETLELSGKMKGYYDDELEENIPVRASFERK